MTIEVTLHKGRKERGFYILGADDVDYERDRLKITAVAADGSERAIMFVPESEDGVFRLRLDRDGSDTAVLDDLDKEVGEDCRHDNPAELPCYLIVDTDNYSAVDAVLYPDAEVPDYRIFVPPGLMVTNGEREREREYWAEDVEEGGTLRVESVTVD
jgi:hypothetical protein